MMRKKLNLLIVDDEEGMRETLSETFQRKDYSVVAVSNGGSAVGAAKNQFFNVLILDMRLPDMDGAEVLRKIKSISPDTEVVIITAYASLQSSLNALNEGAFAYLMKPFEMENLLNTVASAAERQKLILENRKLRVFNENIVQSLNEGILIEDEKGLIRFANPKVEEMFGVPEKKLLKTPFNRYIAPEYLDDFKKRKKLGGPAEKGKRFESAIKSEGKKQISVMISTVPIVLGGGIFWLPLSFIRHNPPEKA
jgi:PAS domain S-box-containing protein